MSDKSGRSPRGGRSQLDPGFDRYLARELHDLYDSVLREAVPAELLKLVEELFEERPKSDQTMKADPGKAAEKRVPKPDPGRAKD